MGPTRIIAAILIAASAAALIWGGFSYTTTDTKAKVGPVELKVAEERNVNVPVWAGVAGLLVGVGLLAASGRRG